MRLINLFKNMKLRAKISLMAILGILIVTVIIGSVTIVKSKAALEQSILLNLDNVATLKADKIDLIFRNLKSPLKLLQETPVVRGEFSRLVTLINENQHDSLLSNVSQMLDGSLVPLLRNYKFEDILLVDNNGKVIYNANKLISQKVLYKTFNDPDGKSLAQGYVEISVSPIFEDEGNHYMYLYAPVSDKSNKLQGAVVCKYNMQAVYDVVLNYTGLGNTGETLLGEVRGSEVVFLNPLRHDVNAALNRRVSIGSGAAIPMQDAVQAKEGKGFDLDYRGKEVIASWKYIPMMKWGLVTKIDKAEAFSLIYERLQSIVTVITLILLVAFILSWFFAKSFTKPLIELESALMELGTGGLPKKLNMDSTNEIGMMTEATNKLVDALQGTAIFAEKIGMNELDVDYKPLGENDVLGNSLLMMRDRLKDAKQLDYERNWITKGLAQFSETLRANNEELDVLALNIITDLVKYLEANQGGLFVVNDEAEPKLELSAMYAYDRVKYAEKEFNLGEGLIGQCWQEGERIYLTDIPKNYINITSGLGDAAPKAVLIMPLKVNDVTYGVIEIASFNEFEGFKIEFVEKLAESIASTVSYAKINIRTAYLLEESKEMTEELRAQEEEMRQNMEEMKATQEEMVLNQRELGAKREEESKMLQEANEMAEEMKAQEEEMRQNMEEMQTTQEEMELNQRELEARRVKEEEMLQDANDMAEEMKAQEEELVQTMEAMQEAQDSVGLEMSKLEKENKELSLVVEKAVAKEFELQLEIDKLKTNKK